MKTTNFLVRLQMVSAVDKSRVKEIESVMEESLKPSERTFYNDLTVNDPDTPVTVQVCYNMA